MKQTNKCWLSPDGQVITCPDHKIFARRIIAERYPSEYKNQDVLDFLSNRGWARFCEVLWVLTGSGWILPRNLSDKQKNTIFDLTKEWFEWKKGRVFTSLFYLKYSLNLSTTLSFPITHINENKSGVCLALHNWIRRNIAKSPTFPTYHHCLNSALLAA